MTHVCSLLQSVQDRERVREKTELSVSTTAFVSYLLPQLMKATVLAGSSGFFHSFSISYALWQTADMGQIGIAPFFPFDLFFCLSTQVIYKLSEASFKHTSLRLHKNYILHPAHFVRKHLLISNKSCVE